MWGVLWELDTRHLASLDKQEGVPRVYQRRHIEVGTRGREVTMPLYRAANHPSVFTITEKDVNI